MMGLLLDPCVQAQQSSGKNTLNNSDNCFSPAYLVSAFVV